MLGYPPPPPLAGTRGLSVAGKGSHTAAKKGFRKWAFVPPRRGIFFPPCVRGGTWLYYLLQTFEETHSLQGHLDWASGIAFWREFMISCSDDGTLRVWDLEVWRWKCLGGADACIRNYVTRTPTLHHGRCHRRSACSWPVLLGNMNMSKGPTGH